jgi:hypothetical protein
MKSTLTTRLAANALSAIIAGIAIGMLVRSTMSSAVYTRDLQEEYLTAYAFRDGRDILTPVATLSDSYFPAGTDNFVHPSPHPPILAVLGLPLTVLSFPAALRCWIGINICVLLWVGRRLSLSPAASLALAAWPPVWAVLALGQLELIIVALALKAWGDAADGRDGRAGAVLGVAAALKLYPLLLAVPYIARRRFRLVVATLAVFFMAQVANVAVIGPSGFVRYYTEIVPVVTASYTPLSLNVSLYAALLRVFGGSADVAPMWHASWAVVPLMAGICAFGMLALWRMAPMAAPTALPAVLPAVWYYHPVVALPQICRLARVGSRAAVLAAVAATCAIFPLVNWGFESGVPAAPPFGALLTNIEPLGLCTLLWLSWNTRRTEP